MTAAVSIQTMVPAQAVSAPRIVGVVSMAIDVLRSFGAWAVARNDQQQLARDAMALRQYAQGIAHREPGLAMELIAAADRAY